MPNTYVYQGIFFAKLGFLRNRGPTNVFLMIINRNMAIPGLLFFIFVYLIDWINLKCQIWHHILDTLAIFVSVRHWSSWHSGPSLPSWRTISHLVHSRNKRLLLGIWLECFPRTLEINSFFKKWANPCLFFVYFRPFLTTSSIMQIEKSIDGVLGIRTRGRRMVGADNTTELWRHRPRKLSLNSASFTLHSYSRFCGSGTLNQMWYFSYPFGKTIQRGSIYGRPFMNRLRAVWHFK